MSIKNSPNASVLEASFSPRMWLPSHKGGKSIENSIMYFKTHSLIFLIFFNIYLLLRDKERHSMSRGGAGREGDTESEAGSRL